MLWGETGEAIQNGGDCARRVHTRRHDGCAISFPMATRWMYQWYVVNSYREPKNREGRRTLARWLSTWVDRVDIELRSDDGRDRDGWPVTVPDGMLSGEMFNDSRGSDS